MRGAIEERIEALGLRLPEPKAPVASYAPYVRAGSMIFISGQLPMSEDGKLLCGKLGESLTLEEGKKAARLCALNVLAQLKAACAGDLERARRCVKLSGFVNAAPAFHDHPQVIDAASGLIVEIFGERGRHARSSVGASSLPLDAAVEIEALFEIR